MPFISTPERVGRREGIGIGIEVLLRVRFGEKGLKLMRPGESHLAKVGTRTAERARGAKGGRAG
jgi:hypothetical protein